MEERVDLSRFNNSDNTDLQLGRSFLMKTIWFLVGAPLLRLSILPSSGFRRALLRCFGAEIGTGVVIRPGVRVKFPWKFKAGKHCWIGEDCWIDNLAQVTLGNNVCLSQAAYLCTGSHNWSDPHFGLITRPIEISDGAWIAARVSVGPGTVISTHAVVGFGSVVTGVVPAYEIYAGNPAKFLRRREVASLTAPIMTSA